MKQSLLLLYEVLWGGEVLHTGTTVISIFIFVLILLMGWVDSKLVVSLSRQHSQLVLLPFHCCPGDEAHEAYQECNIMCQISHR